jgi:hypothetical protein
MIKEKTPEAPLPSAELKKKVWDAWDSNPELFG